MQFITSHTSIPVPKIYCAFVHKRSTYIVMERIRGEMLAKEWSSIPENSREKIFAQLRTMVNEMRVLLAPTAAVANVLGGPLYDPRFPGTSLTIGPFQTIHDFHLFLRNGMIDHPTNGNYPEIHDMILLQDQPWQMPVFTHGDLSAFNILIRGEHVVGIIDWETAGWYPTYWGYSMAWWQAHPYNEFWRDVTEHFMNPPMAEELDMEHTRLRYFGDV